MITTIAPAHSPKAPIASQFILISQWFSVAKLYHFKRMTVPANLIILGYVIKTY
jgi:hypothetical protein